MNEVWKDVPGWEELYQVSNLGNVRTLHYKVPYDMHPKPDKYGYVCVNLVARNSKKYKHYRVHRLVAMTFIPNPNNLPQINHKDENKLNNCVDNLEWCTSQYNSTYGSRIKRLAQTRTGMKFTDEHLHNLRVSHTRTQGKKVAQYIVSGELVDVFDSISDAARSCGTSPQSISHCCRGISATAVGYVWRYY